MSNIRVRFPSEPMELAMILINMLSVGQDFASLKTRIYIKIIEVKATKSLIQLIVAGYKWIIH